MEVFPDPACQDATTDSVDDMPADVPPPSDVPDACSGDACGDPCPSIEAEYNGLVEAASSCDADGDCQVLGGYCGVGLGGCWNLVNRTLMQEELGALADRWKEASCGGPVCKCPGPPAILTCAGGTCASGT